MMDTRERDRERGRAGVEELIERAHSIRRHALTQARGKGEGYIAQGLGLADVLAVLFFRELTWSGDPPRTPATIPPIPDAPRATPSIHDSWAGVRCRSAPTAVLRKPSSTRS